MAASLSALNVVHRNDSIGRGHAILGLGKRARVLAIYSYR